MKSNPIRLVLEWMLYASLLASLFFFLRFLNQSREARALQPELQQTMFQTQNNRNTLTQLIADCQEYAKTHPEMARLLESIRTQAMTQAGATPGAGAAPKPPGSK